MHTSKQEMMPNQIEPEERNMYVTRPLSMYKRFPSDLSLPQPEGPNSGILVILDEETEPTCCFGLCQSNTLRELPFPQNKNLRTYYTTNSGAGPGQHSQTQYHYTRVVFIPVLDQPLSSNQYYAIQQRGRHKGYVQNLFVIADIALYVTIIHLVITKFLYQVLQGLCHFFYIANRVTWL